MNTIEVKMTHPELYEGKFGPAKVGDAGCDLRATQDHWIEAGQIICIKTGIFVNMGSGFVGLVVPRSGLGSKTGLRLANTVGVIDSGYQGEIMCNMLLPKPASMLVPDSYHLKKGERFAQVVFLRTPELAFNIVEEFSTVTERGAAGFGSTG